MLSKEVGGRKRRRSEGDDVEDVGEVLRQVQKKLNESEEQHYFLLEKLGNSEERIMMLEEKEEEQLHFWLADLFGFEFCCFCINFLCKIYIIVHKQCTPKPPMRRALFATPNAHIRYSSKTRS